MKKIFIIIIVCLILYACEDAAERLNVGPESLSKSIDGVTVKITSGSAAIQKLEYKLIELWAGSPSLSLKISHIKGSDSIWEIIVHNSMPNAVLTAENNSGTVLSINKTGLTNNKNLSWEVTFPANSEINIGIKPADTSVSGSFRFALLSDIQGVDDTDMFEMINQDTSVRFMVSAGDVTETGALEEIKEFKETLKALNIPFYVTPGNHDIGLGGTTVKPEYWLDNFGQYNVYFNFKGTYFSLVDSASATIDPDVYKYLENRCKEAINNAHIFITHYPLFDPFGMRNGSLRSSSESAKILAMLARNKVDLTLYGHIHSYYSFKNAGIQAYISGGGGGIQGIINPFGRHFLLIDITPDGSSHVTLVKMD